MLQYVVTVWVGGGLVEICGNCLGGGSLVILCGNRLDVGSYGTGGTSVLWFCVTWSETLYQS